MRHLLLTLVLSLAGLCSFSQLINSGEIIQQAVEHSQKDEYKKAIALYLQVPRNDTNYRLAQFELANAYINDSNYTAALKLIERNLQSDDRTYQLQFLKAKGIALDKDGKWQEALAFYDQTIQKFPNAHDFLVDKAVVYIRQKDWKNAEKLLQEVLVKQPYSSSSHFRLAYCVMQQGRLIPAMMSAYTSLLVNPDGEFYRNAITMLSSASEGQEDIVALTEDRTSPEPTFAQAEQIILSKIALDKDYKIKSSLDDPIIRQLQAMMEVVKLDPNNKDFWMQYYVPMLKEMYNESFEPASYYAFSSVDLDPIQKYVKKNRKNLDEAMTGVFKYMNGIRETRVLDLAKRGSAPSIYHFSDGVLFGKGTINDKGDAVGAWEFYYPNGHLKASGMLSNDSKKNGKWTYYHELGYMSGSSTWQNDLQEGEDLTYNNKGLVVVRENYKNNKLHGEKKNYYALGHLKSVTTFVDGMETGMHIEYFSTGRKSSEAQMKENKIDGIYRSYHNNNALAQEISYKNGEVDGKWINYYKTGEKSYEATFKEGKAQGDVFYYYSNGKVKEKFSYRDGTLEGDNLEYNEDGVLVTKIPYKNGKSEGIAEYYGRDGKLFSTFEFEKDILRTARYFDKSGKEISSSVRKNKQIELTVINSDGFKSSVTTYDDKGRQQGTQTYFYNSGKVRQTNQYEDGLTNGMTVGYYHDGTVEYEVPYVNDEKQGLAKYYHPNKLLRSIGYYAGDSPAGEWKDYNERGIHTSTYNYVDGELDGYYETRHMNGKPDYEEIYQKGWIIGVRTLDTLGNVFHEELIQNGNGDYKGKYLSGKTRFHVPYVKGEFHGEYNLYFYDGKVRTRKNYNMGLLDGLYQEFYHSGKPLQQGSYHLGDRIGTWKYFNEDGSLWKEEPYAAGEINGKVILYHDNGKVEREIEHRNGERHGMMKRFAEGGELMAVFYYHEGTITGYTYPDKNGNLLPITAMPGGNGQVTTYYQNGQKSMSLSYVEGLVHGASEFYFPDGKTMYKGNDSYGLSHGKQLYYYSNGKMKEDHNYYYDSPDGTFKDYYENGQLKDETIYQNGRSHGISTRYSPEGKVMWKENVYYGIILSISK